MSRNRKHGFTLVELLVVISIIGTLMALLLPAVQQARETARRANCLSNQRQVALALLNYENLRRRYPGYLNDLTRDQLTPATWVVAVMPGIEQQNLYDLWTEPDPNIRRRFVTYLPILQCPSDPPDQRNGSPLGMVVNCGIPDSTENGDPKTAFPVDGAAMGIFHNNFGVFTSPGGSVTPVPDTKVGVDNIADGQSTTLLVSENVQAGQWGGPGYVADANGNEQATPWAVSTDAESSTGFVWHQDPASQTHALRRINGRVREMPTDPLNAGVSPGDRRNLARPGSNHAAGVNVTFCDQHGIFLAEDIDYRVYAHLCSPRSGQANLPPEWASYILDAADYEP
jgi:prepilin-type N-terminal cleavage/methylation domain-containing protein